MSLTNDVRLTGHCAEAPIKFFSKFNKDIVKVAIYTRHWRYNHEGILQEKTEVHRCLFFGSNAQKAERFLQKGTMVHLDGSMHYGNYKRPDGVSIFQASVMVEEFTVCDRIALSKEMYAELFPGKEPNRVELSKDRIEREEFDKEIARMENHVRTFKEK